MNLPQLFEIGSVQRTHGVNGEIQVNWTNDFNPDENKLESVFIEIDGIPIPFFITSLRNKGQASSLLKLEDIGSIVSADELVGNRILSTQTSLLQNSEDEIYLEDLVGYQLIDQKGVLLGSIESHEDYAGNTVFVIKHTTGKEVVVPVTPELVTEVDEENRHVIMIIPEGLVDLYLE